MHGVGTEAVLSGGKSPGHERSQSSKCFLDLLPGSCSCPAAVGLVTSWSLPRSQTHPDRPGATAPTDKRIHGTFTFPLLMGQTTSMYRTREQGRMLHLELAAKTIIPQPLFSQLRRREYIVFFLWESSSCPYRSPYYSPLGQRCSQQQRHVIQQPPQPAVHFPHNKLGNNWRSGLARRRMLTSENSLQTNLYNGGDVLLEVQFCVQEEIASSQSSDTWFACKQCNSFCKQCPQERRKTVRELRRGERAEETSKETESRSMKEFEQRTRAGQNAFRFVKTRQPQRTSHRLRFNLGNRRFNVV